MDDCSATHLWYELVMSDDPSIETDTRTVRFPLSLWELVDGYQKRRQLTTKLAALRELVEAGLVVNKNKGVGV